MTLLAEQRHQSCSPRTTVKLRGRRHPTRVHQAWVPSFIPRVKLKDHLTVAKDPVVGIAMLMLGKCLSPQQLPIPPTTRSYIARGDQGLGPVYSKDFSNQDTPGDHSAKSEHYRLFPQGCSSSALICGCQRNKPSPELDRTSRDGKMSMRPARHPQRARP